MKGLPVLWGGTKTLFIFTVTPPSQLCHQVFLVLFPAPTPTQHWMYCITSIMQYI